MKTISLSMIVKNEEKYLADCLKSVKGIADEIILVDTGSTDTTKEIAKSFGAKIYDFQWVNDFSKARNFALSKCTSDYILYLDADEYLSERSEESIRNILESEEIKAYKCRINNLDSTGSRPSIMNYVRLFPSTPEVKFIGAVHEQIEPSILENNIPILNSEITITHTGYDSASNNLHDKAKRNLNILLKDYSVNKSSYVAYQIGQTFHILKDDNSAEEYFKVSVKDDQLNKEYLSTAYRFLAVRDLERMQLEEAEEQIHNSLMCDKDQPLAHLVYSQILFKLGNIQKAFTCIETALEVNNLTRDSEYRSDQNILLDDYTILVQGLFTALSANENEMFEHFVLKLENIKKRTVYKNSVNLLSRIISNKRITQTDIKEILDVVQDDDLCIFIKLSPLIGKPKEIRKFYRHLEDKFKNNLFLLREHAIYLMNDNQLDDADNKFESILSLTKMDPSIYFYRISIALKQNDLIKVRSLINQLETNFKDNNSLQPQIINLKQKLSQFI